MSGSGFDRTADSRKSFLQGNDPSDPKGYHMRQSFEELNKQKNLIVMDGPMGTELERRGYNVNDRLWSAKILRDDPAAIRRIHYDYCAAGADILTCASYQASVKGLCEAGCSQARAEELIALSLRLVQEARESWWEEGGRLSGRPLPLAAGDIGPYGAYLSDASEYTGAYRLSRSEYREFHLPRMRILQETGAEIFAVETMPRLDEALVCAELLEEMGADYWISFTFRDESHICEGRPVSEVTAALRDLPHLKAVGVNCTPPEYVRGIVRRLRAGTDLPICVYPNSGEIYDGVTKTWHGVPGAQTFDGMARGWYAEGARLIGGCCRTTPDDIRTIAGWTEEEKASLCRSLPPLD